MSDQIQDLQSSLQMFTQGVQQLQFHRALSSANDQVQQIKSSEMNDQQQRSALQGVANNLTMNMAGLKVPETTMAAVSGSILPNFANANQMHQYGVLTGDQGLQNEGQQEQNFESAPGMAKAKMELQASQAYKLAMLGNTVSEQNTKLGQKYSQDLDATAASSKTVFGQWAKVSQNGDRLQALLGSPDQWKNMNAIQLQLVGDGLGNMVKGSAPTEEENKVLMPFLGKVKAAQAAQAINGKPVNLDLSGFAGLYSGLADREHTTSANAELNAILNRAQGNTEFAKRDLSQYQETTAKYLNQAGVNVAPSAVQVNKGHLTIPGVTDVLSQADAAGSSVKQAYAIIKNPNADPGLKQQTMDKLRQFGVDPSMSLSDATRLVQHHIRSKVFQ